MNKIEIVNELAYKIQLLDKGDLLSVLNHTNNMLRSDKYGNK
jgi:hypothetical protein